VGLYNIDSRNSEIFSEPQINIYIPHTAPQTIAQGESSEIATE